MACYEPLGAAVLALIVLTFVLVIVLLFCHCCARRAQSNAGATYSAMQAPLRP
jgi:hypothetical protein